MKYTATQRAIAADNGLSMPTVYYRVNKMKWSVEEAITTPARKSKIKSEHLAIAASNGISYQTVYSRLKNGWDIKHAIHFPVDSHRVVTDEEYKIAEKNGISRATVYSRIYEYEWEVKDAITLPVDKGKKYKERGHWSRIPQHLKDKAASNGISLSTLHKRLYRDEMNIEEAITKPPRKKVVSLTKEQIQTALKNKINLSTVYTRVRNGWTKEAAISTPTMKKGGNRRRA
jgi:hypothetical protein